MMQIIFDLAYSGVQLIFLLVLPHHRHRHSSCPFENYFQKRLNIRSFIISVWSKIAIRTHRLISKLIVASEKKSSSEVESSASSYKSRLTPVDGDKNDEEYIR